MSNPIFSGIYHYVNCVGLTPLTFFDPTLANAICDRIIYDSYTTIRVEGDSMRKHKGITE